MPCSDLSPSPNRLERNLKQIFIFPLLFFPRFNQKKPWPHYLGTQHTVSCWANNLFYWRVARLYWSASQIILVYFVKLSFCSSFLEKYSKQKEWPSNSFLMQPCRSIFFKRPPLALSDICRASFKVIKPVAKQAQKKTNNQNGKHGLWRRLLGRFTTR